MDDIMNHVFLSSPWLDVNSSSWSIGSVTQKSELDKDSRQVIEGNACSASIFPSTNISGLGRDIPEDGPFLIAANATCNSHNGLFDEEQMRHDGGDHHLSISCAHVNDSYKSKGTLEGATEDSLPHASFGSHLNMPSPLAPPDLPKLPNFVSEKGLNLLGFQHFPPEFTLISPQGASSYDDTSVPSTTMVKGKLEDCNFLGEFVENGPGILDSKILQLDNYAKASERCLPSLTGRSHALSGASGMQPQQQLSEWSEADCTKNYADHFSISQTHVPISDEYGISKPRVRARRGQATDPHSIAERLRREKIAERMKNLQELVPNASKTDKASMLDEIIEYVKFLQLQVKVLSMSRLGAAGAVVPLITDALSEGTRSLLSTTEGQWPDLSQSIENAAFEQEIVKLMESNVTSAMQLLQTKGLCLMPIALAAAISGNFERIETHSR